ncbi:MAG: sulfotransferase domain-containing protein [Anaerolineales bacterium]|nr:sulfotransferase domain-containing protein [Anaerolineales bacterium]
MSKKKKLSAAIPSRLRSKLRTFVYRAETAARRPRFSEIVAPQNGWPILLGISFPKSGTHLLNQILLGFSEFTPFAHHIPVSFAAYDGNTGRKRSVDEALNYLNSLRPLDVTAAHLLAWSPVVERVCSPDFIPFFIYRDPRDVVVSHVFYIAEMLPDHHHHRYYAEELHSFDERLAVSILGLPDADVEFPNIAERFSFYTDWLDHAEVLQLHFEDFIHNRRAALGQVYDHVTERVPDLPITREKALDILEESINPKKSPTFRSGKTGDWKKYFTEEHKRIFKEVAGDLLIRLGYEEDRNW